MHLLLLRHFVDCDITGPCNRTVVLATAIVCIMITRPCNLYPLAPHFYIVKLWFTGVYILFLFLL